MIMAGLQILERYPAADGDKIRHELDGNICRCTGYDGIVRAILAAAQDLKSGAPAAHSPRDGLSPENASREVTPAEKEA
jgi:carbon-monoxide dehydrogenase small subunit